MIRDLQITHAKCTWPQDPGSFVTSSQVAAYLGYPNVKAFHRDKAWRDAHGFPPQPLKRRWRASAIMAWLAAREAGQTPARPANDIAPAQANTSSARERLARLAAQVQR